MMGAVQAEADVARRGGDAARGGGGASATYRSTGWAGAAEARRLKEAARQAGDRRDRDDR